MCKPECRDKVDGGERPRGEEDDDGGADGLGKEGGHVGGREEVLEDEGEGELALGRLRFVGRGLDATEHVESANYMPVLEWPISIKVCQTNLSAVCRRWSSAMSATKAVAWYTKFITSDMAA